VQNSLQARCFDQRNRTSKISNLRFTRSFDPHLVTFPAYEYSLEHCKNLKTRVVRSRKPPSPRRFYVICFLLPAQDISAIRQSVATQRLKSPIPKTRYPNLQHQLIRSAIVVRLAESGNRRRRVPPPFLGREHVVVLPMGFPGQHPDAGSQQGRGAAHRWVDARGEKERGSCCRRRAQAVEEALSPRLSTAGSPLVPCH
jgi:hypothetical protein